MAHQSVAFTKNVLEDLSYAGPFHSEPPCGPGQNRVGRSGFSGASTFSRVVVGVWNSSVIRPLARSTTDNRPSLFADATSCLPPGVVTTAGPADTSQS